MQVPRGLFLVTCTGTRAWTPASGPRTLLSAKGGNIRVPPSISSPLHVAKLAGQAVLPGTRDRRPHPITGTSNKECCEQSRPCSCYSHTALPSAQTNIPAQQALVVRRLGHLYSSGPSLHPQPQSQAAHPPLQLASRFLSKSLP